MGPLGVEAFDFRKLRQKCSFRILFKFRHVFHKNTMLSVFCRTTLVIKSSREGFTVGYKIGYLLTIFNLRILNRARPVAATSFVHVLVGGDGFGRHSHGVKYFTLEPGDDRTIGLECPVSFSTFWACAIFLRNDNQLL